LGGASPNTSLQLPRLDCEAEGPRAARDAQEQNAARSREVGIVSRWRPIWCAHR